MLEVRPSFVLYITALETLSKPFRSTSLQTFYIILVVSLLISILSNVAYDGPPMAPANVRGNRQFWFAVPPQQLQPQPFIGPNPFFKELADLDDPAVRAPLNQSCVTKNGV